MATVSVIPFSPGRRPTDEARHPGMGSSDAVAFLEGACYLLLAVTGGAGCSLDATLSGSAGPRELDRRPIGGGVRRRTARCCGRALDEDRPYVLTLTSDLPGDYSFATLFSQRLDVRVRLTRDGAVAVAEAEPRSRSTTWRSSARSTSASSSGSSSPTPSARPPGLSARLPPMVPGAADRRRQGRALHARAGRRHRRQAPQPRRPGLARARRACTSSC